MIAPICNTKKLSPILRKPILKTNTFKPPVSGHPKSEDLAVIRLIAYENQLRDGLFQGVVQTHLLFGREFFACNFLVMICELSCGHGKFFYILSGLVHTANKKIPPCVKWSFTSCSEKWKVIKPLAQNVIAGAYNG